MKIVHLVHNFPPEFRGGTEIYLQGLCRQQMAAGRDVTVIAGSEKRNWIDDLEETRYQGIRVLRFRRIPTGEEFGVNFISSGSRASFWIFSSARSRTSCTFTTG